MVAGAYGREAPQPIPPKADRVRQANGKPIKRTEHQEQCAVLSWWSHNFGRWDLPYFALFAIPNGGARDVITGARLKAEGVRRGTPDLMLAARRSYAGLFIEMKVGDNKPTEEQKSFIAYLNEAGYKACVHWSADDAIKEIEAYLGG